MKSQILIWTLLGIRGVLAEAEYGKMYMETQCITYLSTFLVPVSSPGQSSGKLTGTSSLQVVAENSSVALIQTDSQSALGTLITLGTAEVSTSSGFEFSSVGNQLSGVGSSSETPITTEESPSTSSVVLESTFSTASLTSTSIIEPPGRIVIFLIREPTPNAQKRSFNRRQNTDEGFVGDGNPDSCTDAESFNLAQEQLFIEGVPFFYNGQDFTELTAGPVPPVGAVTRIFGTSSRLLEIRNPDIPDGAGFCLASDGTVYVTFTNGPAGYVPIVLKVYDERQCQNGRLVGLDTTTSAAETITSTIEATNSGNSTNDRGSTMVAITTKTTTKDTSLAESSYESARESSSISQDQSVAPISETTTSAKASTAAASSASTSFSLTNGITTSDASTEFTVSSPVPRESSTEGVSLSTAPTLTSAVDTSIGTAESTSIKPASSETSEADTTRSEDSTSSVEPETSTIERTTAASNSEATTVQTETSIESTTSETSTTEFTTLETFTSDFSASETLTTEFTTLEASTSDFSTSETSTTKFTTLETFTSDSSTLETSALQSTSSQSTSLESTTDLPSITIAQTTSNSPTDTTLSAAPTSTGECEALSDPYTASNGDRFDLSCSRNLASFNGGGSEQADLVDCLEDCSTDPSCEGVQYTKANQNCVFLSQKVGTVPNNAYDVAFRA
ncbi:hypothetical protein FMUND_13255 [Fusarium mundagurra]|uniref:Apple domain-containing protein n=1 Tax=Fusarium mundagurra TaxID=1567541 RepID=A0A8H6D505_9HYPO|nr:hypothetical protein FMUND_13255 [Fusarium mundagurra]